MPGIAIRHTARKDSDSSALLDLRFQSESLATKVSSYHALAIYPDFDKYK
jgi:hypothetical protein